MHTFIESMNFLLCAMQISGYTLFISISNIFVLCAAFYIQTVDWSILA